MNFIGAGKQILWPLDRGRLVVGPVFHILAGLAYSHQKNVPIGRLCKQLSTTHIWVYC